MRHKKKPVGRAVRVAEQIQKDLAGFVSRELRDPRLGFVTLTDVELTPDYAYATVYFSVLAGSPDDSEKVLNDSAGFLRNLLFKKLRIHTVPTLRFKHDPSVERGAYMAGIINDALGTASPEGSTEPSAFDGSASSASANSNETPNA